jgi:hypothetical protein
VDKDSRVRDLLAAGSNAGLTTKTMQTDALERIARGEQPEDVVNTLSADQGVLVVSAITDDAALRTIQAKAKYPQVAQAALNRIAGGAAPVKRSPKPKAVAPEDAPVKRGLPRNPAMKRKPTAPTKKRT